MKAALLASLLGALFVASTAYCPSVPVHKCVKDDDATKCAAVKVCEDPVKEKCGNDWCAWPYKCASKSKTECKNFLALKEKCDVKKACKEVKKPCGDGYCSLHQDCVKDTVCQVKHHYGRRLLDGGSAYAASDATAIAKGGSAYAKSGAAAVAKNGGDAYAKSSALAVSGGYEKPYVKPCGYCSAKEVLECEDTYSCVAKDPCKVVTVQKCVKDALKPGIDVCHGGYDFDWFSIANGGKCGDDYCGYGYKCASVFIQKCKTPCGPYECDYGSECVADYDDECKQYAYLETICRDVYEPVCVALSNYAIYNYAPPCKTVYKCDKEESVCGDSYCAYGYVCVVDYKKSCDNHYTPTHDKYKPAKPHYEPAKPHYYEPEEPHYYEPAKPHYHEPEEPHYYAPKDKSYKKGGSASASSSVTATEDKVDVDVEAHTTGDAKAAAKGLGVSDAGVGYGKAEAEEGEAEVKTAAKAKDGIVTVDGEATAKDDDDDKFSFFP